MRASISPVSNRDLEAVTDNSQQAMPLDHQPSSMHQMKPNYDEIPEHVASSNDADNLSEPELTKMNLKKLMQAEEKLWQQQRPHDYALLDFVQKKTQEFLVIQD